MEHHRKQAKALLRAFRAGDEEARRRVEPVLGERAAARFVLADAQHVVAREQGHRTWAELKRANEERAEWLVDTGLRYGEEEPVLVLVRKRLHRHAVSDRRAAARLAGLPPGWEEVAHEVVVDGFWLNVDRSGRVAVGCSDPARLDRLVARVGEASLALYRALLELDDA